MRSRKHLTMFGTMDSGIKYFSWTSQPKMTRCLSDFPVGHVIQVGVNGFLSNQINPKAVVTPHHKQNSLSQFADDTAQWAFSLNVRFSAKFLQQDLLNLAMWCAKRRIKLNLEKTKVIIFSRSKLKKNRTQPKTVWRDTKSLSSSEISRNYF